MKEELRRGIVLFAALLAMAAGGSFYASAQRNDKLYNRPYADGKAIHLGFSVGAHFQDLKFTHNGYVTEDGKQWGVEVPGFDPGFCVNVLADFRLHQYFNVRVTPGMYFGSKRVVMFDPASRSKETQDVKSAYIVLPVDLKVSGDRLGNSRPYFTVGAMGSFDVGKKRTEFLNFNSLDAFLTVGLGCDFYLPYFKFIPEIKFCFGLTDILKHNRPDLDDNPSMYEITKSLTKVRSNMFVITFYFE